MKKTKSLYHGHRFPAVVISCAVRWYFRFSLSLRDIEELLLERGAEVRTRRSVAGATSSALDSPSAPKRRGASRAAHGIWMRCS
jgi:transposase-like protein